MSTARKILVSDDFDLVTIRLRKGDREILRNTFFPKKYNEVIRGLVSVICDRIIEQGRSAAQIDESAAEISLDEIEQAAKE